MLKSHFNLKHDEENAEEAASATHPEEYESIIESPKKSEIELKPERKLHSAEICSRLSVLGRTAEGDGYAYLKVNCNGMNLTDVGALRSFKHLQYVDVSNNNLDLKSLQVLTELPYLLLIHADKNNIHSAALNKMKYLQVIIFNHNQIPSVHDVFQPELSTLEVGYNKIQRINFENTMPTLKCLDFRYNFINDISNLDFPNLDSLYLAGNKITSLVGIERLHNLRILHVRNNPIKHLNGFEPELSKLQYVNLRNSKVATLKQVKKLRVLPALETLILKGCPYLGGTGTESPETAAEEEDPELRIEVLAALPKLKRFNKGVVAPEERKEANELMKQWLEEGEMDIEEIDEETGEQESQND
ncbi:leucine-rich repeat-containing protein 23-like [Leptidea sinapis]|uniref:leucine-rich repeat-containing protein 23-like n=1 Tax=Leptidea sinapis TaxID=189913 RepID=UPI002140E0AF|nr:leucine-rich repeat-containing protein 23-like [Leptidea sinapis]